MLSEEAGSAPVAGTSTGMTTRRTAGQGTIAGSSGSAPAVHRVSVSVTNVLSPCSAAAAADLDPSGGLYVAVITSLQNFKDQAQKENRKRIREELES